MTTLSVSRFDPRPFEQMVGASLGSYRLEQLIELNELGPVFLARGGAPAGAYRLRLLAPGGNQSAGERARYLADVEQRAAQIAGLQHPYILPLVDFGAHRGIAYLVYPHLPVRSLSTRLTQNGPVDLLTSGRYLDQIARALEYAHEHGVVHGNLTVDCTYLQLDGQIVVADFGVRGMIDAAGIGLAGQPEISAEASAPEQLTGQAAGQAAGAPADVYALGALLYHLLTGHPVFSGATIEEIAAQHLRRPVPSLAVWRTGLPPQLDQVIAAAMAKQVDARLAQPGALANTYHQIITPGGSARMPFVTNGPPSGFGGRGAVSRPTSLPSHASQPPAYSSPPGAIATLARGRSVDGGRSGLRVGLLIFAVAALLLGGIGVAALRGGAGPGATDHPTAQVVFIDATGGPPGRSDAVQMTVSNLGTPASGLQYDAWIVDDQTEQVTPLGTLVSKDQGKTYSLTSEHAGVNLLSVGNRLEVTLEHPNASVPVGQVVLGGAFPAQSFVHIGHVLVSFPSTPGQLGLLPGALQDAGLVREHARALAQASNAGDQAQLQCEAQRIVNLIEGTSGAHYRAVQHACSATEASAGDGYGMLGANPSSNGYVAGAMEHLSLATGLPDATANMRTHAQVAETVLGNVRTWNETIDHDALTLLSTPAATNSVVQEISALAETTYSGTDSNHDGRTDPSEGGVLIAYQQAQLMATITLVAPKS
jgi:serine/threonine protein kinase